MERFIFQLKSTLKAHPNPIHWTGSLPIVLLGARTQLKEDIPCTAAELVYNTTLHIPGEFFDESIAIYNISRSNLLCHQAEDCNERPSSNTSSQVDTYQHPCKSNFEVMYTCFCMP